MFKRILAIDIASRMEHAKERVSAFCQEEPLFIDHATLSMLDKEKANDVDALLVSIYDDVAKDFLEALPQLRSVCILGTSSKKLDAEYCKKNGITVSVVKEYCDDETAEWVLLQLLKFFRERPVPKSAFQKTLGIIGFGSVGKKLAQKADGLGLKVLVNTLSSEVGSYTRASKEEIFAACDIVSFHTPPHSPWLLKEQLKHCKEGSLLINTCFGVIDKNDALRAFLGERPDVTLILDQIAKSGYESMPANVKVGQENAYLTEDAKARLVERFFDNLRSASSE